MMDDGAAIPLESVADCPDSGRQRRVTPTPSAIVPGGQGDAVPALPAALPVAAGPVVPVPGTVVPVPSVPELVPVPAVPLLVMAAPAGGEAMARALLPVRPEAPIPAPVLDVPLVPPAEVPAPPELLPPADCATATVDAPSSKTVASGRIFRVFMTEFPR